VSKRFFATLADYLAEERPETETDQLFVALKGRRRGHPLSAYGLDEIVEGARHRAGIAHLTCHQLRHTCLTRLREAGMALEAVQAQAGHRSIESTRIYLHLANAWLAEEYTRAADAIEADQRGAPGQGSSSGPAGAGWSRSTGLGLSRLDCPPPREGCGRRRLSVPGLAILGTGRP
jgi:hypothetical protein